MFERDESSNKTESTIEIVSEGTQSRPAMVRIQNQTYVAFDHDPNTVLVLEDVARGLLLRDLPTGIALTPCKGIQYLEDFDLDSEIPVMPSRFEGIAPFRIYQSGPRRATLVFTWYCNKDFWENSTGYRWKLHKVRSSVLAKRKTLGNLRFHRFTDFGYVAGIEFTTTVNAESMEAVMKSAYKTSQMFHSVVHQTLQPSPTGELTEAAFVRETFIPLLKSLGFRNVIFHHGPQEYGRDVIFSRQSEFGIPEYWAAQAKLGNVSGKSNSYIDLIVNQAEEAFKVPFYDVHLKTKFWISKFVVVISGKYTFNAIEKICQKIESHAQRNNIIFLDGEKVQEMIRILPSSPASSNMIPFPRKTS